MPVDRQVFLRYQILNKCFRNKFREYTIDDLVEECNKALFDEYGYSCGVSKRTVQNDIAILQLPPYNISLEENLKKGNKRLYRYQDTNFTLPLFRMNDEERNKIDDAINVLKQFEGEPQYDWASTFLMQIEGGLFNEDTTPVVTFQSNPDLIGLHHFNDLLRAITTKRVLKLCYTPYGKDTISAKIYPYHLMQYNDRWYLIAQVIGFQSYSHYALDRIDSFEEIALPYKEADIDFTEYFDDVIGVTVPDTDCETIVMRISKPRFEYIRTKPLHLTQRIKEEKDNYAIITINVKINKELESIILSFGDDIEVLAPESFRDKIASTTQAMNNNYLNNEENLHRKSLLLQQINK